MNKIPEELIKAWLLIEEYKKQGFSDMEAAKKAKEKYPKIIEIKEA